MTSLGSWHGEAREYYRKSLRGKLENLQRLTAEFEKRDSSQSWETLRVAFHRIRGSAGSYDYTSLGELCARCEEELIVRRRDGEPSAKIAAALHPHLEAFARIVEEEGG